MRLVRIDIESATVSIAKELAQFEELANEHGSMIVTPGAGQPRREDVLDTYQSAFWEVFWALFEEYTDRAKLNRALRLYGEIKYWQGWDKGYDSAIRHTD